jgi:hypothetical protein
VSLSEDSSSTWGGRSVFLFFFGGSFLGGGGWEGLMGLENWFVSRKVLTAFRVGGSSL